MKRRYGKQFEAQFKSDWSKSFPDSILIRLKDDTSGYFGYSANICDFVGYDDGKLYLLEVKSHRGNTFPLADLTQYSDLASKCGKRGVRAFVVIWFIDHDVVTAVPIEKVGEMMGNGVKSINVKTMFDNGALRLESVKKRVFMNTDYSPLGEYRKGIDD